MMAEGGDVSLSSGSKVVFDFFCEPCIDDNKQVDAEGFCVDCREYLCGSCYSGHRKTRATRHHELQDKSNMPKDMPLSTDRVSKDITTKCKVHNGEPLKYYCKSHAVLGCSTCFLSGHRGCQGIEHIIDISENVLESQVFKDLKSKLQLIQTKSRDIEAIARENKTVSQKCCIDVVSMVRKLKEKAILMLCKFEQDIVSLANKMMSEDKELMTSVVEHCKELNENIEQLSSEFESLKSSKRVCQLYLNMRETESEVKTLQEKLSKLEEVNVVRTFTFEPNDLSSFLRGQNVLGTISHHFQDVRTQSPATSNDPDQHQQVRAQIHETIQDPELHQQVRTRSPETTKDHNNITVKQVKNICIKSGLDTSNCCISGSAVVSNNRLLITDMINSNVKLVDTHTNTLISQLKLSSAPRDIIVFNKIQAAVTLPESKRIVIMKVSPLLTQEREIIVCGECRGIAYSQFRLLVTYDDNPRLETIDLFGKVTRTIANGSDGKKLFTYPWYVCASRDGETIYVSDCNRHTVTSLTRDGVVKALYKDDELRSPRKVCTDHRGNVYVCDCLSNTIHMITADFKKIKVILTQADGLDRDVWSVSHCQDTNRLFVGMAKNVLNVYQLS